MTIKTKEWEEIMQGASYPDIATWVASGDLQDLRRIFTGLDSYQLSNGVTVFIVQFDGWETTWDDIGLVGDTVSIDGIERVITGVEWYAKNGPVVMVEKIGLMVETTL